MKTIEDKEVESRVQRLPRGRKLPFCDTPRNRREAIAKINNASADWEKTTEDFVFRVGTWFTWLKNKLPHGEFERAVAETRFKIRTVRNMMNYVRECHEINRVLSYHPNPKAGKSATVAVLESPEVEDRSELGIKKPKHDSEPLNWSAAETAQKLLEIFEKLTGQRAIEDMEDVASQFDELVREYIDSRREDRRMMSTGGQDDDIGGNEFVG